MKFVNAAKAYRADCVVMGGDITGKLLVPVVQEPDDRYTADVFGVTRTARTPEELDELRRTLRQAGSYTVDLTRAEKDALDGAPERVPAVFARAITDALARWFAIAQERLEPAGIPIYISPGNDDEDYVDPVFEAATYVRCPEARIVELPGGYEMVSCGYANVTPFDSHRELPEDQLEARVSGIAEQLRDPSRAVFNLHCPPHNTSLDAAPLLDDELRPVVRGGAMMVAPAGSIATRRVIERYGPLLGLHGHIHESRGVQKIGRTTCINPGSEYSEGVLRGALVELNGSKLKGWQLTVG
jgi:Icc-related predicted phosphoesterase